MNNENDIIVGLDIGTTKIACFIGRKIDNKVRILGFGKTPSKGVERGVVKHIKFTAESIARAVEQASEEAGVEVKEVYVGIAGQHIRSVSSQGMISIPHDHKLIEQSDVDHLIEEQYNIPIGPGEEIIHVFPQTYFVDGEELNNEYDPVGVAGVQLKANFHIVTGNTTNLINIRSSVEMAGFSIKGVVLEPVASAYAVLDDTDREAGVALVDIGGGTTDIAIFHEGIIRHTSVLPLAGNAITFDIKESCKIMQKQAEALKTRFGSCLPEHVNENDIISIPGIRNQPAREISVKTLAGIIKARTESILEQVDFEIKESHLDKRLIAGIVLTGGGAQLRHIKDLTEFITGIDTRIGLPDEHLEKGSSTEIVNPMYATGIGLVLYGLEREEELRRYNTQEAADEVEMETPIEEPEPKPAEPVNDPFANPFGNFGATIDPFAGAPTESVETEPVQPVAPANNKPSKPAKGEKPRRWGRGFTNAIEKYLKNVFSDDPIRNEGEEEQEL